MAGKIIYTPDTSPACESYKGCEGRPDPATLKKGTVWQCDYCLKQWVVVVGSQYNEYYSAWRKLTKRNAAGDDVI